jgi:hypothetical protein
VTEQNWIAKSIIPKSDQLNAEDLLSGPITVTVTDVKQGTAEQPITIIIDGERQPYKPCKTMRKMLVFCWSDQAANWIGKRMTLYADPDVKWAGVAVGGIRISHLSGIESQVMLMLSETKGKRKPITVKPLPDEVPQSVPVNFTDIICESKTSEELDKIARTIVKSKPTPDDLAFWKSMVEDARKLLKEKAL